VTPEPAPGQVAALFQAALELPAEKRAALLDESQHTGAADAARVVRAMLADMEAGIDGFLETPMAPARSPPGDPWVGSGRRARS